MSASIPPAPPALSTAPLVAGGEIVLSVTGGGAALDGLVANALIQAVAQARAAKGVLELMTANGPLTLKGPPGLLPPFPAGADFLLQFLPQPGGAPGLRMLAVNGRAMPGVTLPEGFSFGPVAPGAKGMAGMMGQGVAPSRFGLPMMGGQPQAAAMAPGGFASPLAGMPAGMGLTATMIRSAASPMGQAGMGVGAGGAPQAGGQSPATAFGLPPDLPAGTRLTVRIAAIATPDNPAAANALAQAEGQGAASLAPGGAPGTAPPRPGTAAAASSLAGNAHAQASAPDVSTPALPVLSGTVVAHPPGGQAVVRTAIGTLSVPTPADLPVGTSLTMEVVSRPLPPPPAADAPPPARSGGNPVDEGWPALTQAMDTLAANDRQALDMLMRSVPHMGPRLAAGLAMFSNGLRNGDIRSAIGEGIGKSLEKAGKRDLAERLKDDLEAMADEGGRPVAGGEWLSYTLPFVGGAEVVPIRLLVRRPPGEEESSRKGGSGNEQRFVLDFSLSHLGRLQLDGLVRREDKTFDLIIRTAQPFSAEMRRDIMGIFVDAAELVGTRGGVSFQSGGRWIDVIPAAPVPTSFNV